MQIRRCMCCDFSCFGCDQACMLYIFCLACGFRALKYCLSVSWWDSTFFLQFLALNLLSCTAPFSLHFDIPLPGIDSNFYSISGCGLKNQCGFPLSVAAVCQAVDDSFTCSDGQPATNIKGVSLRFRRGLSDLEPRETLRPLWFSRIQ